MKTTLSQMLTGFAVTMSLASMASAKVKIEMPDPSYGYTVCYVEGMNKVGTIDQVDSSDSSQYQTFGKSASKHFQNSKLSVQVEILENYANPSIKFHVESLVSNSQIASSVILMSRGGYYDNTVNKPAGHFEPGEYQFIKVICKAKRQAE